MIPIPLTQNKVWDPVLECPQGQANYLLNWTFQCAAEFIVPDPPLSADSGPCL